MKRCAFLSTDNLEGYFVYDELLYAPLKQVGWDVEAVSWHDTKVDWNRFDVVVVRSTWDYQQHASAFMQCLERIDESQAVLANSLRLLTWNISKEYLKDIASQGISIVPTIWLDTFDLAQVSAGFERFSCEKLVVKPCVSANADDTYLLDREQLLNQGKNLKTVFNGRAFMVQPFIEAVVTQGEYSLFYFNGHFSHAILKKPEQGDFRVQEEHGGSLQAVEPDEEMLTQARHTMASLPDDALYARIDLLRYKNEYVVIEIELIEPSLYFNMDDSSPANFVEAFVESFGKGVGA
ncbi:MAG: ATP-grasp domain-containing protein [Paraglaciecola chathamensis]